MIFRMEFLAPPPLCMSHVFPLEESGHHRKMARRTSPPQKGPGNRWFSVFRDLALTVAAKQLHFHPACLGWWSQIGHRLGLNGNDGGSTEKGWMLVAYFGVMIWYGIRKSYLLIYQERGGICDVKIHGEFNIRHPIWLSPAIPPRHLAKSGHTELLTLRDCSYKNAISHCLGWTSWIGRASATLR